MAPVKGRVTCNGKPVAQAQIIFSPVPPNESDKEAAGKPASGFSDNDGYYVLSTYKVHDGALIGQHRVTISLEDTNPAARHCKKVTQLVVEVKAGDNDLPLELK
jgi:hypothetical protein